MIKRIKRGARSYGRALKYEVRRNRNGQFYFPWKILLTIAALVLIFPYLKKFFVSLGSWMERTFSFLSGDGGASAQAQQELKNQVADKINDGFKKWGITPSVTDMQDAAQIIKWNNTYRGLIQSYASTNVPHAEQIKALNLLGFCVPDGQYMYYPAGHREKLYPNILKDFNKNVDRYRLAGIIKAYGSVPLPDRQTPIIGLFLENTTGTLPQHIQEFYSKEYADLFLPYIFEVINQFS